LAQVLRHLPQVDDPRILIDAATRDDAAVFQLSDDRALVASVDFFAPIVDDPYEFGRIAAANAFSDIYAMGATPLFALNLVAWPRSPEIMELLGDTLRGGYDIAQEAGAFVVGGHSIDDTEPKYGMVTLGEVHPSRILSNAGAAPGDALVLTKPLGTGILSTALKRGAVTEEGLAPAIRAMTTLNAGAANAMEAVRSAVHAATDVTGFGLLGHLRTMLEASRVCARISVSRAPVFDGVHAFVEQGAVPGGTRSNLSHAEEVTRWSDEITEADRLLLADAQTSGGLLIAVDPGSADDLISELEKRRTPAAAIIGEVTEDLDTLIHVGA
jgi:selenide,water dikinase